MSYTNETLATRIDARFGEKVTRIKSICGELTYQLDKDDLIEIARALRDDPELHFEMLIDVCGVDYLTYGTVEWTTESATGSGFSRGVKLEPIILDESDTFDPERFVLVYHLLSLKNNIRLRLRIYTGDSNPPIVTGWYTTRPLSASYLTSTLPINGKSFLNG